MFVRTRTILKRELGMMGAMEATARLEAEAALLKKHDAEYQRLAAKVGHAAPS